MGVVYVRTFTLDSSDVWVERLERSNVHFERSRLLTLGDWMSNVRTFLSYIRMFDCDGVWLERENSNSPSKSSNSHHLTDVGQVLRP